MTNASHCWRRIAHTLAITALLALSNTGCIRLRKKLRMQQSDRLIRIRFLDHKAQVDPGQSGHTSRRDAKGVLLPSRGIAALPRAEVFGKGPGACEGGGVRNPKGAVASSERRAEGRNSCTVAVAE